MVASYCFLAQLRDRLPPQSNQRQSIERVETSTLNHPLPTREKPSNGPFQCLYGALPPPCPRRLYCQTKTRTKGQERVLKIQADVG